MGEGSLPISPSLPLLLPLFHSLSQTLSRSTAIVTFALKAPEANETQSHTEGCDGAAQPKVMVDDAQDAVGSRQWMVFVYWCV